MALVEVIQTEDGRKTSSPTHLWQMVEGTGSHCWCQGVVEGSWALWEGLGVEGVCLILRDD